MTGSVGVSCSRMGVCAAGKALAVSAVPAQWLRGKDVSRGHSQLSTSSHLFSLLDFFAFEKEGLSNAIYSEVNVVQSWHEQTV